MSRDLEDQISIEVNEIIRSKRKTIALIVRADGCLIVRAPLRASERSIREFVESNARWIRKKQAEALAFLRPAPKQYVPGELFLYLGSAYALEIVKRQRKALVFEEKFKLAQSAQPKAKQAFERWYREQARRVLTERVCAFASQYGLQYKKIGITSARTRWGSCSADGCLNFSWRLILAPQSVVDYVVVHELAHTIYHNHSKRFWKRVEKIMPDYKERRKWLQRDGQQLML